MEKWSMQWQKEVHHGNRKKLEGAMAEEKK
jgi:hypothetical protein